jgi:hypothetical protein
VTSPFHRDQGHASQAGFVSLPHWTEQLLSIRLNFAPDQASQVEGRQARMEIGQLKGDFLGEADAKG